MRDVFISHASEDKDAVARPLADELIRRGRSVWFDEYELLPGDSLRQEIERGIATSRVGVVILSHRFFAKRWPQSELDGLNARLMTGERNVLIPVWHELTHEELVKYAPMLADRLALPTRLGVASIAAGIERVLDGRRAVAPQPAALQDRLLEALRRSDTIGVREELRRERSVYDGTLDDLVRSAISHGQAAPGAIQEVWAQLQPLLQRRLASLVPLSHDTSLLADETAALARSLDRQPLRGGYLAWTHIPRFAAAWLAYAAGALFVRLERFEAVGVLVRQDWTSPNGIAQRVAWLPSDTATTFGRTLVAGRWLAPEWEHLCRSVGKVEWIPEFQGLDEPKRSLGQFDMLSALWLGTHGHEAVGYFDLSNGGANELALRLHRDPGLQLRVARALGIPDQDLTRVGPAALRRAHGFRGGLTDMGAAANLLETGER